ncbi:MAG: hypothetical protein OYM47_17015 [Gemmatimonadota bacterium]|nr:hypothetical protein [Gemmatimonadota bacterium]
MSERLRVISPESRRFIPPELVAGRGWDRLVRRVGELPGWPVLNRVFFEFGLGDPAPAADFSVRVYPGHPGLPGHYVHRGKTAQQNSAAAALGRFLSEAADTRTVSESALSARFNDIMLEYDIAGIESEASPDPGLFLGLRPAASPDDSEVGSPGNVVAELTNAVGWNDDAGERRVLERVVGALPPGGRLDHVGAMPGRPFRAVRVIVNGIAPEEMPVFLERAGWPGSVRNVMDALADWRDVFPYFRPCFDASARGLRPRLGLEMFPRSERKGRWPVGDWLSTGIRTWLPVLERLEERELCLPAKGSGLRVFPGMEQLFDKDGVYILHKGLNHVKLAIEDGGVQAKAYAGVRLLRFGPDGRGKS